MKTKKVQQIISGKAKSNPQGFSKTLRKAIFDRVVDHAINNKLLSGGGKQISLRSIMIIFFRLMTWYCVKIIPLF